MNEAGMDRMMPEKCPQCGATLPAGALAGLCPACLLQQGAATDTATRSNAKPFVPLTVEEVARHFPGLEILELLGRGGMGAVYKARQKQLDRLVALKILPPRSGDDSAFAERFTREAKALARLNHPGIVTLYEFGVVEGRAGSPLPAGGEDGSQRRAMECAPYPEPPLYYFLMEFVDGVNLRQLLAGSRIAPREALAIVPQICDALQYAHDQGIVHRDIKPDNILLDRRGRVKVADFGLAKIVEGRAGSPLPAETDAGAQGTARPTSLTEAGKVMGTPQYMSPEQVEAPGEVDHRADIYALGVVLYQMLTGELPGKPLVPPSNKVQIDVRLDEVVLRALERKPELRYQKASILKTQVEAIASTPAAASRAATTPWMYRGVDYRSKATLFGLPWLHVTAGLDPATGKQRVAKGIIAIGGIAKGVVAFGGVAMGGLTFGGLSLGVFAYGGLALGLVALGGGAIGYLAHGGGAIGAHVLDAMTKDPVAERFFLPWAPALFAHFQLINAIMLGIALAIGVGLPLWLQRRMAMYPRTAVSEPLRSGSRGWKIAAAVIVAVIALNCVIAILALRPGSSSKSPPASGATMTPRPAKPGGPFLASLPQGTIELVAISRHPSTDQVWWKPDGSSAREGSFGVEGVSVSPNGGKAREFVIRLTGLPEDASWPIWEFDPATGSRATGGRPSVTGRAVANLRQAAVQFPSTARTTTIKLGFGWGQWETLASEVPASLGGTRVAGRKGYSWQVTFSQPTEQEGCAVIAVAHSVKEWEARVIAINKDGQEYPSTSGSLGGNTFQQTTAKFDQLPLAAVKEFEFQVRPYRWVEFRNVSLEPGRRTQVEIVDAQGK